MKSVAKSGQKSCSKGFHQVPSRPNSFKVVQIRSKEFQRVPRGSYDRCCQIWPKKSFQGVPRVPRGSIGYKGLQRVPSSRVGALEEFKIGHETSYILDYIDHFSQNNLWPLRLHNLETASQSLAIFLTKT